MRGARLGFAVTGPGGESAACPRGRGWCQFRAAPSGAGGGWVQLERGNKCFPRVSLSWRLRGGEPLGGAAGPPLSPVLGGTGPGSGNLLQWVWGDWAPGLLCTGGTGPWHSPVLGWGGKTLGPGSPQYWEGTGPRSPALGELPPRRSPFCSPCTRVWGGAREPKPCPLHHLPAYPAAARRICTVRPEGVGVGVSQSARGALRGCCRFMGAGRWPMG